jgi:MoaA/NifB/PqqE/SkfB family radical SAM enzyme
MERDGPAARRKAFTLLVELRCNSYCVFCGQREVDEPLIRTRKRLGLSVPQTRYGDTRGRYTLETATVALREAREGGFTELSLQGGEPTIWPDLVPLIAEARRLGFDFIGVVTNGRRLKDRAFAEALLSAGLDGISASLLGADAETHDAISAAPGSFDALIEGLRNASSIARELKKRVTINANVITTAKSVDRLADQVRLLASCGVASAGVHLVRFSGLAADPLVREPLRFDIRRVTRALREGTAEAARLGMTLHATDVPMCLHPRLAAEELELLHRRHDVREHHFQAAAFQYDVDPGRPHTLPEACAGCLLDRACRRVPIEYLPPSPSDALRPLSPEAVGKIIDDELAEIDPTRPGASLSLRELRRSIDLLEVISSQPGALAAPAERVREAIGDLLVLSIARRDFAESVAAFSAYLDLYPRIEWRAEDRALSLLRLSPQRLAALTGAIPPEHAASLPVRLRIGDRLEIALAVREEGRDGELTVKACRPILLDVNSGVDQAILAVFLLVFCEPLRKARRIKLTEETLLVDIGRGLAPAWGLARPGAIVLTRASPEAKGEGARGGGGGVGGHDEPIVAS